MNIISNNTCNSLSFLLQSPSVDGNLTTIHQTPVISSPMKRLSPLAEKIAEIERKNELTPKSISDMLNQSSVPISTKVDCGSSSNKSSGITAVGLNGFLPPLLTSDINKPVDKLDTTLTTARCQPIKTCFKRKLLYSAGIHQRNCKAARLSTVSCHCYPPVLCCVLCSGRHSNVKSVDPFTMSFHERVALLSSTYHPVLSVHQGKFVFRVNMIVSIMN